MMPWPMVCSTSRLKIDAVLCAQSANAWAAFLTRVWRKFQCSYASEAPEKLMKRSISARRLSASFALFSSRLPLMVCSCAFRSAASAITTRYYENKLQSLPTVGLSPDTSKTLILVVNARNEHMTLRMEDIAFFRYSNENKQWEVICSNKKCYSLRHRTTADAILIYSNHFVQTHKRYIVNINYIKTIRENACLLKSPMEDVTEVKISKNYKRDLINEFYNL